MIDPTFPEVVQRLRDLSAHISTQDTALFSQLTMIEERIRRWQPRTQRPIDVPFEPWGRLAWSMRRGLWRLAVIEPDEVTALLRMPRGCRCDAMAVLPDLLRKLGILA